MQSRAAPRPACALLLTHVLAVDAGDLDRLLHGITAERLAELLVEDDLEERRDALLLVGAASLSAAVSSAVVVTCTPLRPQAFATLA